MTLTNVTIYTLGMFGVHRTDCDTVTISTGHKYAQYSNATRVLFERKGKRKNAKDRKGQLMLTNKHDTCIIVDQRDAVQPRDPMENVPGGRQSRFSSYDMAYWQELKQDLRDHQATACFDFMESVA